VVLVVVVRGSGEDAIKVEPRESIGMLRVACVPRANLIKHHIT
jgi:hypothetical protein